MGIPKRPVTMCSDCEVPLCTKFKPIPTGKYAKLSCAQRFHICQTIPTVADGMRHVNREAETEEKKPEIRTRILPTSYAYTSSTFCFLCNLLILYFANIFLIIILSNFNHTQNSKLFNLKICNPQILLALYLGRWSSSLICTVKYKIDSPIPHDTKHTSITFCA